MDFNIQFVVRLDWENITNEYLVKQGFYLAKHHPDTEHLKATENELLRRMTMGAGWAYFDVEPSKTAPITPK